MGERQKRRPHQRSRSCVDGTFSFKQTALKKVMKVGPEPRPRGFIKCPSFDASRLIYVTPHESSILSGNFILTFLSVAHFHLSNRTLTYFINI